MSGDRDRMMPWLAFLGAALLLLLIGMRIAVQGGWTTYYPEYVSMDQRGEVPALIWGTLGLV